MTRATSDRREVLLVTGEAEASSPLATHTLDLLDRLAERGWRVRLLALADDPAIAGEVPAGTPVHAVVSANEHRLVVALGRAGLGRLVPRAKDLAFRAWLRSRAVRSLPVLVDGGSGGTVLPFLTARRAPVVWLLHGGERPSDTVLRELAGAPGRRPLTAALAVEEAAVRALAGSGVARDVRRIRPHRADPAAVAPPEQPVLGLVGSADAGHGADLVGRLLWALRACRGVSTTVRWLVPEDTRLPPQLHHDLRRLGLLADVDLVVAPGDLRAHLASLSAVVLPWRERAPGAPRPDAPPGVDRPTASSSAELLARAAGAAGRQVVGFAGEGGVAPGLPGTWVRYPEVGSLAAAASEALDDAAGRWQVLAAAHGGGALTDELLQVLAGGFAG